MFTNLFIHGMIVAPMVAATPAVPAAPAPAPAPPGLHERDWDLWQVKAMINNDKGPLFNFMHLDLLFYTSDAGPDEVGCRSLIHKQTMSNLFHWLFDGDCLMHQLHIIVKAILNEMDQLLKEVGACGEGQPLRYYGTLAKIMHTWRDNARQAFDVWLDVYGAVAALHHARKVPPNPLVGRWGNTGSCEARVKSAPVDQWRYVMRCLLEKRIDKSAGSKVKKRKLGEGSGQMDEMGVEETAERTEKLGRWATDALRGVKCNLFYLCLLVSSRTKVPLDHCLYALMQAQPYGEPTSLALLIWGKAQLLRGDLAKLRLRSAWVDIINQAPAEVRGKLWAGIQRVVIRAVAEYDR